MYLANISKSGIVWNKIKRYKDHGKCLIPRDATHIKQTVSACKLGDEFRKISKKNDQSERGELHFKSPLI